MRQIKFRGIDTMSGEMVYGNLVQQELADGSITTAIVQTYATYDVKPETVGQFIGVYDKNGKEVYEGDIVDCWSEGRHCTNGIVKWMQNRIWIASTWDIWNLMPDKNGIDEGLIVVGNIHDK